LLLQNLRIGFVFLGSELGGAERQGLLLAHQLKEHCGADVMVLGLAAEQPGRVAELCEESGIPWEVVPFKMWLRGGRWLWEMAKFVGQVRKRKPDIIFAYTWLPNLVCGLTWKLTGAKTFVWNQRDEGLGLNTSFWHRAAVRLTPCFVANSAAGKVFLANTYPASKDRIEVVHNGVTLAPPLQNRSEWRDKLSLDESGFVACMVANLHQNKDHSTLLKAWKMVLDRVPKTEPAPTLLLAGRFDGMEASLKVLASKLELGKSCRFLDKVADIPGLFQAVDVCVHSSRSEGLPNAILEAMASGLPVIATDIPGNREAMGVPGCSYLVPPDDPGAMAAKILELLDDPTAARNLGLLLKERAEREFCPQSMFEQMLALLPSRRKGDTQ
jgi:glycosyltransferase involved in cell wall biosynthesis